LGIKSKVNAVIIPNVDIESFEVSKPLVKQLNRRIIFDNKNGHFGDPLERMNIQVRKEKVQPRIPEKARVHPIAYILLFF